MKGIGIIGCGKISQVRHIPEYHSNPNAQIIGYFDLAPERAAQMAAKYGGQVFDSIEALLADPRIDAVSVCVANNMHADVTVAALKAGKHVLCETPLALKKADCEALTAFAGQQGLILMEALKTAFSTAYRRLILLLKSGKIGDIVSVEASCTSLQELSGLSKEALLSHWNSITDWGPTGLLPVFQLLGTEYTGKLVHSRMHPSDAHFDLFSRIDLEYPGAVASVKVGKGVKTEGELIVSGTDGYAYVPAPWWKTDFFEIRHEHADDNQRYFYQLEGEGIRNMLAVFFQAAVHGVRYQTIEENVTKGIVTVLEDYYEEKDLRILKS